MIAASWPEIAWSMARIAELNVAVRLLFHLSVPFIASDVRARMRSSARDRSVCFVAPIACSSRLGPSEVWPAAWA